jgi:hypothetical protein
MTPILFTATLLTAGAASAQEPPSSPSAASAPTQTAAVPSKPTSPPQVLPLAEKKGGVGGFVAGGLVLVAVGGAFIAAGDSLLRKEPSSCNTIGCLDFSSLNTVAGGIWVGVGAGHALSGLVLLGVAISRALYVPDAKSAPPAAPTVTVGLGSASLRWTF